MKSKYLIWVILILVFILPGYLAFRYADKICREYLDAPLSVNVTEAQARNFISQVGDIGAEDFPPILDIEKTDGLSAETINERALEWLQIIEKHYCRKPIIYANPHYLNNILSAEITQNYPVWVANYGVSRPNWKGWRMWQFTDRALVRGVGCADLNVQPLR